MQQQRWTLGSTVTVTSRPTRTHVRPTSIRWSTTVRSAGVRGIIRVPLSTPTSTLRPIRTWPLRGSTRSTTFCTSATPTVRCPLAMATGLFEPRGRAPWGGVAASLPGGSEEVRRPCPGTVKLLALGRASTMPVRRSSVRPHGRLSRTGSREAYVGIDVAKSRNAVAIAEEGQDGEVRYLGEFDVTPESMRRLVTRLAAKYGRVHFCYEAGPTGYGLHRLIMFLGHPCTVVAPSLIPRKPSDRVKTNRRDAMTLARLLRAGELTPDTVSG